MLSTSDLLLSAGDIQEVSLLTNFKKGILLVSSGEI
jgi:hypothetical protein